MLLSNKEVLDLADQRLDYSDFGNFYGPADDIVEFAYYVIKAEEAKRLAAESKKDWLAELDTLTIRTTP